MGWNRSLNMKKTLSLGPWNQELCPSWTRTRKHRIVVMFFSLPVINESSHPESFFTPGCLITPEAIISWYKSFPSLVRSPGLSFKLLMHVMQCARQWRTSEDMDELIMIITVITIPVISSDPKVNRSAAGVPCPLQQKHCSHHASAKSKWGWTWMNTLLSGQST